MLKPALAVGFSFYRGLIFGSVYSRVMNIITLDENNQVISNYKYDAFGNLMEGTEENVNASYEYTGQEYEDELDLHNFRARFYDSDLMRFYATDPQEEFASPYLYCGNNPIIFVDPTGEYIIRTGEIEDGDEWEDIVEEINEFYDTDYTEDDIKKVNRVKGDEDPKVGYTAIVGTIDDNGEVWHPKKFVTETYFKYLTEEQQKIQHYHRNTLQSWEDFKEEMDDLSDEWKNFGKTPTHNMRTNGNIDRRKGHYQAIYDKKGFIVKTDKNTGSYDYNIPNPASLLSMRQHWNTDVKPWIKWGNTPQDKTTRKMRLDKLTSNKKSKAGLIMFGW